MNRHHGTNVRFCNNSRQPADVLLSGPHPHEPREVAMPHTLVASDRVEKAPVCGHDGTKLGVIERLMIDKQSGKVAYAVVRCADHFPNPPQHLPLAWDALKYNPSFNAFEVELTADELHQCATAEADAFDWGDRSADYRHPNYWAV
jgi:hypothetical protein